MPPDAEAAPPGAVRDPLSEIIDPVRRFAVHRSSSAHDAEDVLQETLSRVLLRQDKLARDALLPYALVTARNLVNDAHRAGQALRRHAPRLYDPAAPEPPEGVLAQREEAAALMAALGDLSDRDRDLLLAHELDERDLRSLAEERGTTPGALAVQLARTRARLRLDYLLALRRVQLPTERCRPVLLALSAGDQRRQRTLRVGHHLLTCATCSGLAEPVLTRQRALAGLLPWVLAAPALTALRRLARQRGVQVGTATAGLVVAGAAVVATTQNGSVPVRAAGTSPAAAAPGPTAAAPGPTAAAAAGPPAAAPAPLPPPAGLAAAVGQPVRSEGVLVLTVPADEGFWVGTGPVDRVWVQLAGDGVESPFRIVAGMRLALDGTVVAHPPGFAASVGVTAAEGGRQLDDQRAHVSATGVRQVG